MVKLVYTLRSGRSSSNGVRVRVSLRALKLTFYAKTSVKPLYPYECKLKEKMDY